MKGRLGRNPFEKIEKAAATPGAEPASSPETGPAAMPGSRLENTVRFAVIDLPAHAFVAGLAGFLLTREILKERLDRRRTS